MSRKERIVRKVFVLFAIFAAEKSLYFLVASIVCLKKVFNSSEGMLVTTFRK